MDGRRTLRNNIGIVVYRAIAGSFLARPFVRGYRIAEQVAGHALAFRESFRFGERSEGKIESFTTRGVSTDRESMRCTDIYLDARFESGFKDNVRADVDFNEVQTRASGELEQSVRFMQLDRPQHRLVVEPRSNYLDKTTRDSRCQLTG